MTERIAHLLVGTPWGIALDVLLAFLIGSIPFGYLIGRLFYRTDLRRQGSGNIGAMNALRTLGKTGAAAVLLLDAAKGYLPVTAMLAMGAHRGAASAVAVAALLGHCFSPWLGWKGGKGVATLFGALFAMSWRAGIVAVGGWIIGALALTQFSSVGSMLGSLTAPISLWLLTSSLVYTLFGLFAGMFVLYTHRENIARLRSGTENRISFFKRRDM